MECWAEIWKCGKGIGEVRHTLISLEVGFSDTWVYAGVHPWVWNNGVTTDVWYSEGINNSGSSATFTTGSDYLTFKNSSWSPVFFLLKKEIHLYKGDVMEFCFEGSRGWGGNEYAGFVIIPSDAVDWSNPESLDTKSNVVRGVTGRDPGGNKSYKWELNFTGEDGWYVVGVMVIATTVRLQSAAVCSSDTNGQWSKYRAVQ